MDVGQGKHFKARDPSQQRRSASIWLAPTGNYRLRLATALKVVLTPFEPSLRDIKNGPTLPILQTSTGLAKATGYGFRLASLSFKKRVTVAPQPNPRAVHELSTALITSSNAPLLLLNADLTVIAASQSFCRAFATGSDNIDGRHFAEIGAGEWNVPQLTSLLAATAAGYAEIKDYELDFEPAGRERRSLVINAHKLDYADNANVRLLLAVSDITEALAAESSMNRLLHEKELLLRELQHRVANSLQIIASVLMQSARKAESEETRMHLHDAHKRVMSVAAVQDHLAVSSNNEVELRSYLTALCRSIGASMIHDHTLLSLEVNSDEARVSADISVSVGLIVTELVINALKHAFPKNQVGKIIVDYRSDGLAWTLSVRDNGVGMPKGDVAPKAGLGTSIVQALTQQLQAHIKVAETSPGTSVFIFHTQAIAKAGAKSVPFMKAV